MDGVAHKSMVGSSCRPAIHRAPRKGPKSFLICRRALSLSIARERMNDGNGMEQCSIVVQCIYLSDAADKRKESREAFASASGSRSICPTRGSVRVCSKGASSSFTMSSRPGTIFQLVYKDFARACTVRLV